MTEPPEETPRSTRSILPEHWTILGPMIDELLDTPVEARADAFARLAGGVAGRRDELERLVADCEREMPLLERPALERFAQLAAVDPPMPMPDVLGARYRLGRELGRGGMARVYVAEDLRHARSVAVKVVRPELAESIGRDRFLREIAIAARLRHPNIMPLYDSGDADGLLYYVMPYEAGQSLRDRLTTGDAWTVAAAVSVLRDVVRALVHAHEQGVVHRDVKPENVMLSGGAAVVTDFGIAKAFSAARAGAESASITKTGVVIGTPAYMSPEQAAGDPATDHRADIYAFGCVAFELLTGKHPFEGNASWEMLEAKRASRAPLAGTLRADVPPELERLIARCLERSPADRPQRAGELLAALDDAVVTDAAHASPKPGRRGVRRVLAVTAGVTAVVAVTTALAMMQVRRSAAPQGDATFSAATAPAPPSAGPARAAQSGAPLAIVATDSMLRILVVLPMQNSAGASLDYIASGLADEIGRRLEGVGGFAIRSGARSDWPAETRRDYQAIARPFGATVFLKTELERIGDSLQVRASVANRLSRSERQIAPHRFAMADLPAVAGKLAAAIAGAAFRAPNPSVPHGFERAIDPESYRLTLEGWHEMLNLGRSGAARALFLRATEIDPRNARAWAGLSSTWAADAVTDQVPFDEGYLNTVAAATKALESDSLDGSALANLAVVEALNERKASAGLALLARAKKADPSNPEVYLIEQSLYLFAWQLDKALADIRIARELDPLTSRYPLGEASVQFCADRPALALSVYDALLRATPGDTAAKKGRVRALARLGRYDDALTAWRIEVASDESALAQLVRQGQGPQGYWAAKHAEGALRLDSVVARAARQARMSASRLAQAKFAAGDFDGGFAELETMLRDQHRAIWRIRCNAAYDEVLAWPRFKDIVRRAGALPLR